MNKHKDKHHPPEEAAQAPAPAQAAAPTGSAPAPAGDKDSSVAARPAETDAAAKLKKAEEECARLKDQLLRLGADFENFRKRSLREKNEICENANEALALELLPIIDHLQLALKSAARHKADHSIQEGLRLIYDQLLGTLAKFGLDPFESEKQPFDPSRHEAVSYLPSAEDPEGTIITQTRPGFRFKNRVLRPAQVVVSSGKPVAPQPGNKENSNN